MRTIRLQLKSGAFGYILLPTTEGGPFQLIYIARVMHTAQDGTKFYGYITFTGDGDIKIYQPTTDLRDLQPKILGNGFFELPSLISSTSKPYRLKSILDADGPKPLNKSELKELESLLDECTRRYYVSTKVTRDFYVRDMCNEKLKRFLTSKHPS